MKRAYRYRFSPAEQHKRELLRTFGCLRLVYDKALQARTEAWHRQQRRVSYAETSALLTSWKKTDDLAFLSEVSPVPWQQALRHLQSACAAFFDKRARDPHFKSRRAKARREVARGHARITDRRRDHPHKLTTRLVRENRTVVLEDLNVRGTLSPGTLARAISEAARSEFRTMLERKAAWYGREVIVVDRWFPSSKTCSACGELAGSMPLQVRSWTCTGCGAIHDRDVNAARNTLAAGLAVTARGDGVRPARR